MKHYLQKRRLYRNLINKKGGDNTKSVSMYSSADRRGGTDNSLRYICSLRDINE